MNPAITAIRKKVRIQSLPPDPPRAPLSNLTDDDIRIAFFSSLGDRDLLTLSLPKLEKALVDELGFAWEHVVCFLKVCVCV